MEAFDNTIAPAIPSVRSGQSQRVPHVMIVSRGRGRGHATPDIAIGKKLSRCAPDVRMTYVSYATGAETFRLESIPVVDMQAGEDPEIFEMIPKYMRLLIATRPTLVVAHEEYAVIAVAQDLRIPCVFITDYFIDPAHSLMKLLRHALEVVFVGSDGVFTEPPYLRGRITYVGRAVRQFGYSKRERAQVRAELGLPPDATVGLVQPGGWRESRAPAVGLILNAWRQMERPRKHLFWVAGADYDELYANFRSTADIDFIRHEPQLDRLIVASDFVITKSNRMTVYECATLGVPSISLSYSLNWPDEVAIARVNSNKTVPALSTSSAALARLMQSLESTELVPETDFATGIDRATDRILVHLTKFRIPLDLDRMKPSSVPEIADNSSAQKSFG